MSCNKCKQVPPFSGDTWCVSCSAWEAIGSSLCGKWVSPGVRGVAAEIVVGAARQVRELRKIDASLAHLQNLKLSNRDAVLQQQASRDTLPATKGREAHEARSRPPLASVAKAEESSRPRSARRLRIQRAPQCLIMLGRVDRTN